MKKGNLQIYYEKKDPKKKNPWKSLLKNLLLMNTIALVVYVVTICLDDEINASHHFLTHNVVALTVWLFNLFFPWD